MAPLTDCACVCVCTLVTLSALRHIIIGMIFFNLYMYVFLVLSNHPTFFMLMLFLFFLIIYVYYFSTPVHKCA